MIPLALVAAIVGLTVNPTLRFCSGSVCASYGSPLVLEAAQALSCLPGSSAVATAKCMKACNKVPLDGLAVTLDGEQQLLNPCVGQPQLALQTAFDALGAPSELEGLRLAIASKLDGDTAAQEGDLSTAIACYTKAMAGIPDNFLADEQQRAALDLSTQPAPPPSLTGLPPSRLAALLSLERERTTPGRVRWLYESLLGRARGYLAVGDTRSALSDAQGAAALCPLAPDGWAAVADAAESAGNPTQAAEASERAASLTPEGMSVAEVNAFRSPRQDASTAMPRSTPNTRLRAALAYGAAISGIVGAIAFRKTPGNEVGR